jgi:hypothetical protein
MQRTSVIAAESFSLDMFSGISSYPSSCCPMLGEQNQAYGSMMCLNVAACYCWKLWEAVGAVESNARSCWQYVIALRADHLGQYFQQWSNNERAVCKEVSLV